MSGPAMPDLIKTSSCKTLLSLLAIKHSDITLAQTFFTKQMSPQIKGVLQTAGLKFSPMSFMISYTHFLTFFLVSQLYRASSLTGYLASYIFHLSTIFLLLCLLPRQCCLKDTSKNFSESTLFQVYVTRGGYYSSPDSAYRKPAFQPSAFRRLFIGFQPSAEKSRFPWEKVKAPSLDLKILQVFFKNRGELSCSLLVVKFFYQSEKF